MENIEQKVKELKNSIENVGKRREQWNNTTKDLIVTTLNNIKQKYDIDCNVYVNDFWRNGETVILSFGINPSGIIEENDKGIKSFTKHGGSLMFSQVFNGEIYVVIKKPYIEGVVEETNGEFQEKISPEKISEEYIKIQVTEFLQKMIDWENFTE